FDGETEPRIECKAGDLANRVPPLGPDRNPLLTFIPYSKSLKVVVDGLAKGTLRLEHVTFPADTMIETYSGRDTTVPRGLLPALSYRWEQHGWGTVREHDPAPRVASSKKTIEPGATLPLANLDGTGVVQWLKL